MFYKEFKPSAVLQNYVDRYWVFDADVSDSYPMEHVLTPNGMDGLILQYHMESPNAYRNLHLNITLPPNYVLVQPTAHWKLFIYASTRIAGIFFKPGILQRILKYPMNLVANQPVELDALIGNTFNEVCDQMMEVDPATRIYLIERLLCRLLDTDRPYLTSYAETTARIIQRCKGGVTISQLSDELRVSRQFITKQFTGQVGVSPKEYTQIVRFNAVHQYIATRKSVRWTDVTYLFGYSDQSHFIKEFRKYMGMLPTEYPILNTEMANFYAGGA